MSEAADLHCELCGGRNVTSSRACGYCHAPLHTVRCAHCYQLNPPTASLCQSCNAELGLEPIELPQQLDCQECGGAMRAFSGSPGVLHDCETCRAQFVDHALLRDLLQRRTAYGRQVAGHSLPGNPLVRPVRYLNCPVCQKSLLRQNFGGKSGIIVHRCIEHGTWFHTGELPRVLSFVEAGGLREAKQAELGLTNPLTDEARRALGEALQQARQRRDDPFGLEAALGVREAEQEIFEACEDLLEAAGRWLEKRRNPDRG